MAAQIVWIDLVDRVRRGVVIVEVATCVEQRRETWNAALAKRADVGADMIFAALDDAGANRTERGLERLKFFHRVGSDLRKNSQRPACTAVALDCGRMGSDALGIGRVVVCIRATKPVLFVHPGYD